MKITFIRVELTCLTSIDPLTSNTATWWGIAMSAVVTGTGFCGFVVLFPQTSQKLLETVLILWVFEDCLLEGLEDRNLRVHNIKLVFL